MKEQSKKPVVKKEIIFALPRENIDIVTSTLQRITLYRAAARMTGHARDLGNVPLQQELEAARQELLTTPTYSRQFQRIQNANADLPYTFSTVKGTAYQGNTPIDLVTMDDVLAVVAPDVRTTKLSLCMGKRFIHYNTLDPSLIDPPVMKQWMEYVKDTPGLGKLRDYANELMPQISRKLFEKIGLDPRFLDNNKPAVGYLKTWTRHPDQLQTIIDNAQHRHGAFDTTYVRTNQMMPALYFSMEKSPLTKWSEEERDPIMEYFIGSVLLKP